MTAAKSLELIRSNQSLRQKLAEKDSEIELLKARIEYLQGELRRFAEGLDEARGDVNAAQL
jgi:predicted nuclease with TOPRIM domain